MIWLWAKFPVCIVCVAIAVFVFTAGLDQLDLLLERSEGRWYGEAVYAALAVILFFGTLGPAGVFFAFQIVRTITQ